jgi:Mg-chelatase subunit ChlD
VDDRNTLPSNLDSYAAIIVSNLQARDWPKLEPMTEYVRDGGGMVVFGGPAAYDKGGYKGTPIEAFLPVNVGQGKPDDKKTINIVFVIDVSGSSGRSYSGGSETIRDKAIAQTVGIIRTLKNDTKVGVVAFNSRAYQVAPMLPIGQQDDLEGKVSRLTYNGSTLIQAGVQTAINMIINENGGKNIVLISDGKQTQLADEALKTAAIAGGAGMRLYTVGVGIEDTDETFMRKLADLGRGDYFRPTENEQLKIVFAQQQELQKNSTGDMQIRKLHHFITERLILKAEALGFNFVVPKSSAEVLVALPNNQPILTVWRVGLGRIAAVSTDTGSSWAPDLLKKGNSLLISRTINWAIGDPSRTKTNDIVPARGNVNEPFTVYIKAPKEPEDKTLVFSKIGEDVYSTTVSSAKAGFVDVLGTKMAVNYPEEYSDLGVSPLLEETVKSAGGSVFGPADIDAMVQKGLSRNFRTEQTKTSLIWILAGVALGVFLLELILRRLIQLREA